MEPTRREFLHTIGTAGVAAGSALSASTPAEAAAIPAPKTVGATETTTVCPFCGVGYGQVVSVKNGKVVSIPEQAVTIRRDAADAGVRHPRRRRSANHRGIPDSLGSAMTRGSKRGTTWTRTG